MGCLLTPPPSSPTHQRQRRQLAPGHRLHVVAHQVFDARHDGSGRGARSSVGGVTIVVAIAARIPTKTHGNVVQAVVEAFQSVEEGGGGVHGRL